MPSQPDPTTTTSRPKFHAVITYVPEEFIWCDWLHRQLDGVAVPADLASKRTRHGFSRPPHVNVFPDPRNPTHLARYATSPPPSRYLVVICTPHSASAPALEEQIRAFKRTGGEDRIVVLVADGDPEHDDAPAGEDDAAWLPAWLRWRLDEKGNFRPAEASEPQIIDARADKLDPPEARAHLLAALLDMPREDLHAYGDLLSEDATETVVPQHGIVEAAVVKPEPPRRSLAGLFIGLLFVAIGIGAWWWSNRPAGDVQPLANTAPSPAAETPTPAPAKPTAVAKPAPTPKPSIVAMPVAVSKPQPTPAPAATPPPAPSKPVATMFAPSEGPETPITDAATMRAQLKLEPGSSWQRMRDLGDTLIARDNRDTALIALTQAVDIGIQTAAAPDTSDDERLDIARLCFRVGALQKQFVTAAEARRTLQRGRDLLASMRIGPDLAAERDSLLSDTEQLLRSVSR